MTPVNRFVTVRGHRIRYQVRPGDADRTPLLFCNGIGASHDVLEPVIEALDPAIPVVRFDVPGTGFSPTPALPYTFQQLALTASRLMTELGFDGEFDVLGFSWGGALAQQLAWQHRCRVRRLVLLATGTGFMMVPGDPRVLVRMLSPRRFRDPEYAAHVAGLLYGGRARADRSSIAHVFRDLERGGSRRGYAYQLLAGSVWTSLPWLPTIRQPTLVLSGDDDPIIPTINARLMRRLLPHARLHLFAGGHVEPLLAPAEIVPVISSFLLED